MATEAIKPTLHTPVRDGRRYPVHFRTEGEQVLLFGLKSFESLGLSESDTANSAIEKLAQGIEDSKGAAVIARGLVYGELSIPADGWTYVSEGVYFLDIENARITQGSVPEVTVYPDSEAAASACGLRRTCETFDGALRFLASRPPSEAIIVSAAIIEAGEGGGGGGIPVATKNTLGGVKVGDGLAVTGDGTISVDLPDEDGNGIADIIDSASATDADVDRMLDDVYGSPVDDDI